MHTSKQAKISPPSQKRGMGEKSRAGAIRYHFGMFGGTLYGVVNIIKRSRHITLILDFVRKRKP